VVSVLAAGWFKPPCACHRSADKHSAGAAGAGVESRERSAADGHACCGGGDRHGSSDTDRPQQPVGSPGCCPGGCPRDCTSPC